MAFKQLMVEKEIAVKFSSKVCKVHFFDMQLCMKCILHIDVEIRVWNNITWW